MASLTTNTSRHTWLTREFLENILKSSESNQNVKVIDFIMYDAVPKGENYTSYILRVVVNYTDENGKKQKSFVIKTLLESEEINEKLKQVGLFDKEIAFYRDIVPEYKKYFDLFDKDFQYTPRCYAANDNPTYIVFEDLTVQNYRNMDRRVGLDFNATAMVLQKLAKMHAVAAIVYENSPQLFEAHKVKLISREKPDLLWAYTNGVKDVKKKCQNWPGYEQFNDKLDSLINDAMDIAEFTYTKGDNTFNTLMHGDLWGNNIMYQYDENNIPIDVRMVDFQGGFYGPPAVDISYLFYTSTVNDMFEQDWDRLLQIYHTELVATLKLVHYPSDRIPSLTELQIEMLKRSLGSAMLSFTAIPARHLDCNIEPDMHTLISGDQVRLSVFDKPAVYERIQYLLDFYNRKGFFDHRT